MYEELFFTPHPPINTSGAGSDPLPQGEREYKVTPQQSYRK